MGGSFLIFLKQFSDPADAAPISANYQYKYEEITEGTDQCSFSVRFAVRMVLFNNICKIKGNELFSNARKYLVYLARI